MQTRQLNPTKQLCNFKTSQSVDRRLLPTRNFAILCGSKLVKCPVRWLGGRLLISDFDKSMPPLHLLRSPMGMIMYNFKLPWLYIFFVVESLEHALQANNNLRGILWQEGNSLKMLWRKPDNSFCNKLRRNEFGGLVKRKRTGDKS